MTLTDLKRLVVQGESSSLEFKRKVSHPDKIIKELVAFANTTGGKLLIGVNDDGRISGTKYPDDEIFALNKAINEYCRPLFNYDIIQLPIDKKKWVVIYDIPQSIKRPHFVKLKHEKNNGQAFVRYQDKSVKASREVCEIIKRKKKDKDIKFHFGEKEQLLMRYLATHPQISLKEFQSLAKINYYIASRTLILLVLANVLEVIPTEKGDFYQLKKI